MAAMAWQFRAGNVAQKKWLGGLDMSEIHIKKTTWKNWYIYYYMDTYGLYTGIFMDLASNMIQQPNNGFSMFLV